MKYQVLFSECLNNFFIIHLVIFIFGTYANSKCYAEPREDARYGKDSLFLSLSLSLLKVKNLESVNN